MEKFNELYNSIGDRKERTQLRNEILKRCSMPYSTFYMKINKNNFSALEQKEIAVILKKPLCELFPVEKNKYSINI